MQRSPCSTIRDSPVPGTESVLRTISVVTQSPRPLPPRYQTVADLLAKGQSPADIAARLGVRDSTAAYYISCVRSHQSQVQSASAGVPPRLSRRETQVASLLEQGVANAAIATELGIGRRTVETYVSRVLRATGKATRKDFVHHRNPSTGLGALTFRELQVLHLMAQGLSNGQIARRFNIDERTVESHAVAIRKKLRVPGHKSLARFGMDVRVD